MQYNYFLFAWEVILLHSTWARFARHSCCAKVLLLSSKESNSILPGFNILLFPYNSNNPIEAIATNATSPSPSSSSAKSPRRVSFSEDEAAINSAAELDQVNATTNSSTTSAENNLEKNNSKSAGCSSSLNRGSLATSLRQMTVPMAATTHMSYLQVK